MAKKSVREIRCAMTDEEYHELIDLLADGKGLVSLTSTHVVGIAEEDSIALVGLRVIAERLKSASALMQACWDKTAAQREPVEA